MREVMCPAQGLMPSWGSAFPGGGLGPGGPGGAGSAKPQLGPEHGFIHAELGLGVPRWRAEAWWSQGDCWERQAPAWPRAWFHPCRAGARRSQVAGWALVVPGALGAPSPSLAQSMASSMPSWGSAFPGGGLGPGGPGGIAGSAKPQLGPEHGFIHAELGLGVPRLGPGGTGGIAGSAKPQLGPECTASSMPSWGSAFPGGDLGAHRREKALLQG
ncbi:hypothetical protein SAMN05421721_106122 [Ectothiorhodospira mobilis]|uniref:Uncharacterized protein n=1 Tax=Ectothiorhodospira mobilis TaxID=195064 RepID=A0A1I4R3D8_ECTMO|nr:hypothetical protein SAMN05421721_106122 [Ectothiorhodospira mobilis]